MMNNIMIKMQKMFNQNRQEKKINFQNSSNEREFQNQTNTKIETKTTTFVAFRFVSKKFEFFNFNYQNKTAIETILSKTTMKKTIYRDVHIFMFRAKKLFHIHIYNVIRNEFYKCLQNDVFTWHNSVFLQSISSWLIENQFWLRNSKKMR